MGNEKTIMVMPAGHFQIPAIREARAMGLRALAVDRDPQAAGLALADTGLPIAPSDIDAVCEVARAYRVEAVLSVASDPCAVPAAVVAERLGLAGLPVDVACLCRNKRLTRETVQRASPGFCPQFRVFSSVAEGLEAGRHIGYPLIAKPTDGNGSKGVIVIEDERAAARAMEYALAYSDEGQALAEERLTGPKVTVEAITVRGKTEIVAIGDTIVTEPPFCVIIGNTMPSLLPPVDLEALEAAIKEIVAALGIRTGPTHIEMCLTPEGPKLLDIGARLSGGCIASHLVPLSTGVNLIRAAIEVALGETPEIIRAAPRGAAIRFLAPPAGRVREIDGLDRLAGEPGVVEYLCGIKAGDWAPPLENSSHRAGYVVAVGADAQEAGRNATRAVDSVRIRVEQPERSSYSEAQP